MSAHQKTLLEELHAVQIKIGKAPGVSVGERTALRKDQWDTSECTFFVFLYMHAERLKPSVSPMQPAGTATAR
jgi:hypothetical protein